MIPKLGTLDTIGQDLDEAITRIARARQALQAASTNVPEIQLAIARLERIEAEMERFEGIIAAQAVAAVG